MLKLLVGFDSICNSTVKRLFYFKCLFVSSLIEMMIYPTILCQGITHFIIYVEIYNKRIGLLKSSIFVFIIRGKYLVFRVFWKPESKVYKFCSFSLSSGCIQPTVIFGFVVKGKNRKKI